MYFHSPAAGGEGCRSEATESLRVRDVLPFPRRRRGGMPERSDGIPESEGLLLAGNGLEIIQNLLSQEFNQRKMPVSDKKMSIQFKQRLL